ncbi:aminotransferase class I/II-fold pyridoxal phosphate-dependent enzyme [Paenarthrobacter sp. NPDC056912]|uniref:aminotransferase class I/II-fold pyridoxal phosphate-dependent enzyme n=1 Tax=Paenarthrobacter sp. NPDC056912 TaxID=3345965 RepID=UPI0036722C63
MVVQTLQSGGATERIAQRITGQTAEAIASSLAGMILDGELKPGKQLPTLRSLSKTAKVPLHFLADAWSVLRDRGLIVTRGRGGSFVADPHHPKTPDGGILTAAAPRFPGWQQTDLVSGQADLSLQLDLRDALLAGLDTDNLHDIRRDQVTVPLREALERTWPFPAQEFSTAGGGTEAVLLSIEAAAPPGSVVAIDEPVIPGIADTMRDLGITPIGVACDTEGPIPASLLAALEQHPTAFVYQPSGPFGRNHAVTQRRANELAALLAETETWIIEDDSLGPLAEDDSVSMGALLPDRVLRVRSYCKAYGIDLRTSALGGSAELIKRARAARSHGIAVNSRILQNALAYLIDGEATTLAIQAARRAYSRRRRNLLEALDAEGLTAEASPEGLMVWVEVADETRALLDLAAHGIVLGEGRRAFLEGTTRGYLRIAVTHLPDDSRLIAELAGTIRQAAAGELRAYLN